MMRRWIAYDKRLHIYYFHVAQSSPQAFRASRAGALLVPSNCATSRAASLLPGLSYNRGRPDSSLGLGLPERVPGYRAAPSLVIASRLTRRSWQKNRPRRQSLPEDGTAGRTRQTAFPGLGCYPHTAHRQAETPATGRPRR